MAPPKKKRKTTESTTTDIPVPVSRPRTPRSTRSIYRRSPATVSLNNNTTPSIDYYGIENVIVQMKIQYLKPKRMMYLL
jgi:hypothetical protein